MYLHNSGIFILYMLSVCCSIQEPLHYLTKENVKLWYKNFTRATSLTNPYCSICCVDTTKTNLTKICGKHTMCIYQDGHYGPGCKGVLDIPFLQEEIEVIVDAHNTLRNGVAMGLEKRGNPGPQPQASNMREVEWNKDLALVAHRWASQCVFAHDACRDLDRYPVGQNIAKGSFATNHDLSFIADWFNNVQWMNELDLQQYQINLSSSLRDYTQMVWADTYQIGCARILFKSDSGAETEYNEHFVCNYGPIGNIAGQLIYKIGKACSNCPEGTGCSVDYPGLCKNDVFYDSNELTSFARHREHPRRNIKLQLKNFSRIMSLSSVFHYLYFIYYFYKFH